MENFILIGMPGSGKSTIGVLLAKALGMGFVDTDLVIQETYGCLLRDLIKQRGIRGFLEAEEAVICSLHPENCVVATGGSAVCSPRAMEYLQALGRIIYLAVPLGEVERRVKNITTRGIAMEAGDSLRDVYAARVSLYLRYADCVVDCRDKTIEETVDAVLQILKY